MADGDGLENVDESATTPEGRQIHAFTDPISAMGKADLKINAEVSMTCSLPQCTGTDAFVVRDKIPRTPTSKSIKQTQGRDIRYLLIDTT